MYGLAPSLRRVPGNDESFSSLTPRHSPASGISIFLVFLALVKRGNLYPNTCSGTDWLAQGWLYKKRAKSVLHSREIFPAKHILSVSLKYA
jgi:hypothetical protein